MPGFKRKYPFRRKYTRKFTKRTRTSTKLPYTRKPVDKKQNFAIKKIAKDVSKLKAKAEVKHAPFDVSDAHEVQNCTSGQSTSSIPPTFYCLGDIVRSVGNGTIASDRVGSKINVVRWNQYFRLSFQSNANQFGMTGYSQPMRVRVIIARMKNVDPTLTTSPTYTQISTLLKYDNTASQANVAPANTYACMELPINTSQWAVAYDKQHYMQPGIAGTDKTVNTWEKWSLHRGVKNELFLKMNMKKIVGKVIKFDTASSPSNMKYWFLFHIAVPTGYTNTYLNTESGLSTMNVNSWQRLSYTDS
jgi:hypothetical protein